MEKNKYVLVNFVSGAGTPLFNEDGSPRLERLGARKTSAPWSCLYGVSADGGRTVHAYGFAPPNGSEKI